MNSESPLRVSSTAVTAACIVCGIFVASLLVKKLAPTAPSFLHFGGDTKATAANQSLQEKLAEFQRDAHRGGSQHAAVTLPEIGRESKTRSSIAEILPRSPQRVVPSSHKSSVDTISADRSFIQWTPQEHQVPQFYAPVTVHPVTVNIDNSAVMRELSRVQERLDSLSKAQNAAEASKSSTHNSEVDKAPAPIPYQVHRDQNQDPNLPQSTQSNHAEHTEFQKTEPTSEEPPTTKFQPRSVADAILFAALTPPRVKSPAPMSIPTAAPAAVVIESVVIESVVFESGATEPKAINPTAFSPRPFELRSFETRTFEAIPAEPKPAETKTFEAKPVEPKHVETRTFEPMPVAPKVAKTRTFEAMPVAPKAAKTRTFEAMPVAPKPAKTRTFEAMPVEPKAVEPEAAQAKPQRVPEVLFEKSQNEAVEEPPSSEFPNAVFPAPEPVTAAEFVLQVPEHPAASTTRKQSKQEPIRTPEPSPMQSDVPKLDWSLVASQQGAKRTTDPPFMNGRRYPAPALAVQSAPAPQKGEVRHASYTKPKVAAPGAGAANCRRYQHCQDSVVYNHASKLSPAPSARSHAPSSKSPASRLMEKVGNLFRR